MLWEEKGNKVRDPCKVLIAQPGNPAFTCPGKGRFTLSELLARGRPILIKNRVSLWSSCFCGFLHRGLLRHFHRPGWVTMETQDRHSLEISAEGSRVPQQTNCCTSRARDGNHSRATFSTNCSQPVTGPGGGGRAGHVPRALHSSSRWRSLQGSPPVCRHFLLAISLRLFIPSPPPSAIYSNSRNITASSYLCLVLLCFPPPDILYCISQLLCLLGQNTDAA